MWNKGVAFLLSPNLEPFFLHKDFVTLGSDASHDLTVETASHGIVGTVRRDEGFYALTPGALKVFVNAKEIKKTTRLSTCDRIEWDGGQAVFYDRSLGEKKPQEAIASQSLQILQDLAGQMDKVSLFESPFERALLSLVEITGAEAGYLLSEYGQASDWELLASTDGKEKKKELISHTILQEAIKQRHPIYIESIVGHPWSEVASVVDANIFSVLCLPLILGARVFGAVFLYSRTPGKSLKNNCLSELQVLATQASLMIASQAELKKAKRENMRLKRQVGERGVELIYSDDSDKMKEVERRVEKFSKPQLNNLILGETGTGKEVVARLLHEKTFGPKKPFVALNCAAIPATLMESTLFGYTKGAFTGAEKDQQGKFLQAHGGTLFLDEIGDLPLDLQAKLLRVLQEGEVEPVGAQKVYPVDVKVVAATHQDLERAIEEKRFRQDLYFRLNGATIRLPALRERAGDIGTLARHFLMQMSCDYRLAPAAQEKLEQYSWPGNVRELAQVVARSAALCEEDTIQEADIEFDFSQESNESTVDTIHDLKEAQFRFTHDYVQEALRKHGGNRKKAAIAKRRPTSWESLNELCIGS